VRDSVELDEDYVEMYGEQADDDDAASTQGTAVAVVNGARARAAVHAPTAVEWWQGGCDYNSAALLTHAARALLPALEEHLTADIGEDAQATMCALYMVF
jgi:hypothetical protein